MSCEPLVLRGAAAGAARPVVFGQEPDRRQVLATGPWADLYDEVRAEAHQEGYHDGLRQGRQVGEAQGRDEVATRAGSALRALGDAADRLARVQAATADELAPTVVELALELAGLILQRELVATAEPAREALARVLPLAPDQGRLTVRLNPDDLRTLGPIDDLVAGRDVTVVADPGLASGDAVVDAGPCRVEHRLDDALARVTRAIRGQEATP